jgi:hypothetical protein
MTTYRRDFTVAATPAREVIFTLNGVEFVCLPDCSMDAMELYRSRWVVQADDPTRVGIPLNVAIDFIEAALIDDESRELFRKTRGSLDLNAGSEAIHAIREYLVECYSEVGPTTGPPPSSAGPPVSGPTLRDVSGSPDAIPSSSPSAAT